jgi:hypothetical protein
LSSISLIPELYALNFVAAAFAAAAACAAAAASMLMVDMLASYSSHGLANEQTLLHGLYQCSGANANICAGREY